jgi:hypothetical protein
MDVVDIGDLRTAAEVITDLTEGKKYRCVVVRKEDVTCHDLCDYCNHDGEDIFKIAYTLTPTKKNDNVIKLHRVKVCHSCMFFFRAIEGVAIDKDTV